MSRFEIIDGRCIVPEGVTEILEEEFQGCEELIEVVLPQSVKKIGASAFCWCSKLRKINIPHGVSIIQRNRPRSPILR